MGCNESKTKGWALRCRLEAKEHPHTAFATLTYRPGEEPVTLQKRHLQLFLKRLRKRFAPARTVRFFACGEYGEKRGRPHYHAILFGASEQDRETIQKAWPHGHTHTVRATPAAMAYTAGYTAKKYGDHRKKQEERVDPETGEVYTWQPPFIQMSMKPGIGGKARTKYRNSWRNVAIDNGKAQAVPRYLHEGWKATATEEQKEILNNEKAELMKRIRQTPAQRAAGLEIAIKKQEIRASKRQQF